MSEPVPTSLERAMNGEYVEQYALRRYLWKNYGHLLTDREQALYQGLGIELKIRHSSSGTLAAYYRSLPGCLEGDPEVTAIADLGMEAFQQRCCERIWREFARDIYLNHCERCDCITASPIACACLWCGHHWYERRAEMITRSQSPIYPKPAP